MPEIVAIEYRQQDWASPVALADRVAGIAGACATEEVAALGLAGLLSGAAKPLSGTAQPALLFGFRLQTLEAAVAVAEAIGVRGYTGIFSGTDDGAQALFERHASMLTGLGLVFAHGGKEIFFGASTARVRGALEARSRALEGRPNIWMPAPDRFERAVDGIFVEEATRFGVDWVWRPGSGINRPQDPRAEGASIRLIEAWHDDGTQPPAALARWVRGDRVERGKLRLTAIGETPRRWLREAIGWR